MKTEENESISGLRQPLIKGLQRCKGLSNKESRVVTWAMLAVLGLLTLWTLWDVATNM